MSISPVRKATVESVSSATYQRRDLRIVYVSGNRPRPDPCRTEACPALPGLAMPRRTLPACHSTPRPQRTERLPEARGKQFSDRLKYFIAEVTNPASLTLQSCDSEAASQSGTSHPTGGMLKMLNTILLAIMLTILGIAISPPGSYHRIFIWRIIIGACVVGTAVVASAG